MLMVGESTTVSALVGDVDGDLLGGSLLDVASGQTLGVFGTPGGQGTFSYVLTWSALNAAAPIDGPTGQTMRVVRAIFVDGRSNQTSRDLTMSLSCGRLDGGVAMSLCSGVCADLSNDPSHCGQCRRAVPQGGQCQGGTVACTSGIRPVACGSTCADLDSNVRHCGSCGNDCTVWATQHGLPATDNVLCSQGTCQAQVVSQTRVTCDSLCLARGLTCTPIQINGVCAGYCASYTTTSHFQCTVNTACGATPPATSPCSGSSAPFTEERCGCG